MTENYNFGLISQHIGRLLGLYFSEKQLESMGRSVMKAALELKRDPQPGSLQKWLGNSSLSKNEVDSLARHLSVGETYFFREHTGLDFFTNEIIPALRKKDPVQEIRIWSAGCSSGEEPYTLAMLLRENIPDLNNRNIKIHGSDLNPDALRKAQKGVYSPWSFRETPEAIKNKYFAPVGKHFEIKKEIRQMVTFFQLNLAGTAYPSSANDTENIDVIFCRNVLMYFVPEMAIEVSRRFYQALKPDGWLITSQVELHEEYYAEFNKLRYKKGVFYRKSPKDKNIPLFFDNFTQQAKQTEPAEKTVFISTGKKVKVTLKRRNEKRLQDIPEKVTKKAACRKVEVPSLALAAAKTRAEKLFDQASYDACSEFCLAYFEKKPFDKRIGELLVRSLANLGKHNEARQWAEKLIMADGEHADYLNLFASILIEQGDLQMAEKTLIKTLYLNPHHAPALFNMYCALTALKKNKLANKYYNNLLSVIQHLDDHREIPGLEGMTAGVVRTLVINRAAHERKRQKDT